MCRECKVSPLGCEEPRGEYGSTEATLQGRPVIPGQPADASLYYKEERCYNLVPSNLLF